MKYVYSILRFVPDPARGEFVNIGAIVGSDESAEWELRLVSNQTRAKRIDESGALPKVWSHLGDIGVEVDVYLEALEEGAEPGTDISEAWLGHMWEESRNLVQLSPPAPLRADSMNEAMGLVFEHFIPDPESRRFPFKKKTAATTAVRRAFRYYGLSKNEQFYETPTVHGSHHRERFDFVVANGQALQLTQTFSFQIPDKEGLAEDIKAWAFTVEDIRKNGGRAVKDAKVVEVPPRIPVAVVFVPPGDDDDPGALDEAKYAFGTVEAEAFSIDDAPRVGMQASDLVSRVG